VDRGIAPYSTEWDRAESVDRSIVGRLGELGFLGLTISEKYGGSGGDHLAYALVVEELGRGDSAVRGIVSVSLGWSRSRSTRTATTSSGRTGRRGSPVAPRWAASR
jgi:alkylation response protein AidB-like acyl-CoA dehydrogenase